MCFNDSQKYRKNTYAYKKLYTYTYKNNSAPAHMHLPVDIAEFVDRVNSHHHLCQVKLSHVLWNMVTKLTKQRQQVSTNIVIHC